MSAFRNGAELLALCSERGEAISRVMLEREVSRGERTREEIWDEMRLDLECMRESVREGLEEHQSSVTGFSGGEAEKLNAYAARALSGERTARAVAASMAVVEVNSAMGRIVAAPTAGAAGVLPGVLTVIGGDLGADDEALVWALFNAAAIGYIIARNATLSGAEGGCQAETGTAAAMAASALTELMGGTPEQCLDAAATALQNVMGLVCDPVAGLVECPCIKRNALGAVNALISADITLAGNGCLIPFDETVAAMLSVGRQLNPDLRETARGGLAATPTGRLLMKRLTDDIRSRYGSGEK